MKTQIIIGSLILVCMSADVFSTDNSRGAARFEFNHTPVTDVLEVYAKITGKELVISTGTLDTQSTITAWGVTTTQRETEDLIAEILRKNAGVIVTPIDGDRVSVTYNDKLDPMPNGPPVPNKPSKPTPFQKR